MCSLRDLSRRVSVADYARVPSGNSSSLLYF
jgi:hypothetical protein